MPHLDIGGGIERTMGQPNAQIDPQGRIELVEQTGFALETEAAEIHAIEQKITKLAVAEAMFGLMADRLGSRIVHKTPDVPQPASDPVDTRPVESGLFDIFRNTQSKYNPHTGRVESKPVATARPAKSKKSQEPAKPANTAPGKGKKRKS